MDFSVRVRGGGADSVFFVISIPPDSSDHYVQGALVDGRYVDGISLGEKGEYFPEPETVAVFEVTAAVAAQIRPYVDLPGERDPIAGWDALSPAPKSVGAIGVRRQPEGECGG